MTKEEFKKLAEVEITKLYKIDSDNLGWEETEDGSEFLCNFEDCIDIGITIRENNIHFHESEPSYIKVSLNNDNEIKNHLINFKSDINEGLNKYPTASMPAIYANNDEIFESFKKDVLDILNSKYKDSIKVTSFHII